MAEHKGKGFLWACILAVVSFMIIFLFMPEKSRTFFGTSLSKKDTREINRTVDKVEDTAETVGSTIDKLNLDSVIKGK